MEDHDIHPISRFISDLLVRIFKLEKVTHARALLFALIYTNFVGLLATSCFYAEHLLRIRAWEADEPLTPVAPLLTILGILIVVGAMSAFIKLNMQDDLYAYINSVAAVTTLSMMPYLALALYFFYNAAA